MGNKSTSKEKKTIKSKIWEINLLFFPKSSTRCFMLMDLSKISLRSVEICRIWQAHNLIEQFWKILKSLFAIGSMKLRKDGLYTGLLIKTIGYLLIISLQFLPVCRHLSLTQIMRKLKFECDLKNLICEHFHFYFLRITAME